MHAVDESLIRLVIIKLQQGMQFRSSSGLERLTGMVQMPSL